MSDINKEQLALLGDLVKTDPFFKKRLADLLGVKPQTRDPFYSAESAQQVKPIVDEMLKDPLVAIEIRHSDYPTLGPNTIKQKLYAGIKYLRENFDDEAGTYTKWWSSVVISPNDDRNGWIIRSISTMKGKEFAFIAHKISSKPTVIVEKDISWAEEIEEAIKNLPEKKKADITPVQLTQEDKIRIAERFEREEEFSVIVTTTKISVFHHVFPERIVIE